MIDDREEAKNDKISHCYSCDTVDMEQTSTS